MLFSLAAFPTIFDNKTSCNAPRATILNSAFITGYERDIESDLDFAEARYYNKNHGRFTSVDSLLASGMPGNPQTWNRYAYVLNNPLVLIDPTGLIWGRAGDTVYWFTSEKAMKDAGYEAFKPDNWTYQHGDQWVTLNPDGPGSCNAAYDCSNGYFKNGWTYSSEPSTWRKPEAGIQDVSIEFYTAVLGIGSVVKTGVQALGSALLKQTVADGAEVIAAAASNGIESTTGKVATSAIEQVSKRNLTHIAKHLTDFQKIDPSITLEQVVQIGQNIVSKGVVSTARASNSTVTEVVQIAGQQIKVKVVLNSVGGIRSIYPLP